MPWRDRNLRHGVHAVLMLLPVSKRVEDIASCLHIWSDHWPSASRRPDRRSVGADRSTICGAGVVAATTLYSSVCARELAESDASLRCTRSCVVCVMPACQHICTSLQVSPTPSVACMRGVVAHAHCRPRQRRQGQGGWRWRRRRRTQRRFSIWSARVMSVLVHIARPCCAWRRS